MTNTNSNGSLIDNGLRLTLTVAVRLPGGGQIPAGAVVEVVGARPDPTDVRAHLVTLEDVACRSLRVEHRDTRVWEIAD